MARHSSNFHSNRKRQQDPDASTPNVVVFKSSDSKPPATPYSELIRKYVNEKHQSSARHYEQPIFGTSSIVEAENFAAARHHDEHGGNVLDDGIRDDNSVSSRQQRREDFSQRFKQLVLIVVAVLSSNYIRKQWRNYYIHKLWRNAKLGGASTSSRDRPDFVFQHPYVTSSYYTSTKSVITLEKTEEIQIDPKKDRAPDSERGIVSRLAIVRPFCDFDAEALPTTFACWNSLVPCRAAEQDLGDDEEEDLDEWVIFDMSVNSTGRKLERGEEENWECEADSGHQNSSWFRGIASNLLQRCKRKPKSKDYFDDVPADALRTTSADLFLFYSQTFSENDVSIHAVDQIMDEFFSPGGWSRCFDNIYAIEANIPQELDLYIPAAQDELYNWVNGPNRQFEAAFRIIQSGEWGNYDGFYLMEGDSVPVKNYWLDVILGEINAYRPFAVLGAQYDGDKWDAFYEQIPMSLLHHTNGNGIYNTSHPLLERLVGQLEVEAPCPYNSIPYDYRMSQMWVEGTLGIVPKIAPKIMLNEEGQNITLSDNTAMFTKWANRWQDEEPYRFTKAIHNYAATNLIPRHLGPEYVIHGAKLYSPWDPAKIEITLVISEWFFDRSINLFKNLDSKDHPFSKVIIMIPPSVSNDHDYAKYTKVPVTLQFRDAPDVMDLCSAKVTTKWFMITNSYHQVANHVDLMFTPGKFVPVVPFTPATYPFCLKYPYCNEIVSLAQRWNPGHKQVVLDMDMLYNTKERNAFCEEWIERNGEHGEELYATHQPLRHKLRGDKIIGPKGPTGSDYLAYLTREKKAGMYKMTDRSLYGARAPFVKVYRKEEKLDGMSEDELAKRVGMTLFSNTTECSCDRFDTEEECVGSELGCLWRPLFESCHPPEMIDDGVPICEQTEPPTMSPTVSIERFLQQTESPTVDVGTADESEEDKRKGDSRNKGSRTLIDTLFKSREHQVDLTSYEKGDYGEVLQSGSDNFSTGNRVLLSIPDGEKPGLEIPSINENFTVGDAIILQESLLSYSFSSRGGISPSQTPLGTKTKHKENCPTWGPSVVPRRLDLLPSDGYLTPDLLQPNRDSNINMTKLKKSLLPGQSRHTEHQLVQLEPEDSLNEDAIQIPTAEEIRVRRMNVNYGDRWEPLQILFELSSLSTLLQRMGQNFATKEDYMPTSARVAAYMESIFPLVAKTWGDVLMVPTPAKNIVPESPTCGSASVLPHHLKEGVANANVVIYVNVKDSDSCFLDSKPLIHICHFDQHMRPLFGSLSLCLDDLDVHDGIVYEKEILQHVALITQLTGRFLGLSPKLFKYFREPETGQPWGERPLQISCDSSGSKQEILLSNVITQHEVDTEIYYEISTPTVRQVVRNHFDCQSLTGARLSAPLPDPGNNGECTFDNLDLRYHFDEDMTSISQNADAAFAISPLSLALLEDSSWYKANFTAATTPSFGRGAGCGFFEGGCISWGKVRDYSKGFFCGSTDSIPGMRSGCDYTHENKASCDLEIDAKPPPAFQYFSPENPEYGSPYEDVHFCPMRAKHLISCSSNARIGYFSSLAGESFDENSRCYETDAGVPVCLETLCNSVDKTLDIFVNENVFRCRYSGEVINAGVGYSIVCPRIAVICPDIICPSNCSGKGVCDYCKEVPECICDNLFDETPGCWES